MFSSFTAPGLTVTFFDYGGLRINYDATITAQLREHGALLDPRLLYATPIASRLWLRRSARISPHSRLMREYRRAVADFMVPLMGERTLSIVDLGVGDFQRSSLLLRQVLAQPERRLHYAMVDISEHLLHAAVVRDADDEQSVLRRIGESGSVRALRLDFLELARWQHVLPDVPPRYFFLLGNTLANEVDDQQTLTCIAGALNQDDVLFLELQMREPAPLTPEQLSERFRENTDFYSAPLAGLGYTADDVDLVARVISGEHCDLVSVHCIVRPFRGRGPMSIDAENDYKVMTIRKYTEAGIDQLLAAAGLERVGLHATEPSDAMPIVMGYVSATRRR
jgi:hypothetical protein